MIVNENEVTGKYKMAVGGHFWKNDGAYVSEPLEQKNLENICLMFAIHTNIHMSDFLAWKWSKFVFASDSALQTWMNFFFNLVLQIRHS